MSCSGAAIVLIINNSNNKQRCGLKQEKCTLLEFRK